MRTRSHVRRIDAWKLGLATLATAASMGCGGSEKQPAAIPSTETRAEPVPSAAPAAPAAEPAAASSAPAQAPATASSAEASAAPASASTDASSAASGADRSLNDIRATIAGNRDRFRTCYDQSLKKHPGIEGKFVLNFVLHPDGRLKSAKVDDAASQIHADDMTQCAVAVLKTLKFTPSKKGKESTVNYPFDFHPKGPKY